MEQPPQSGGLDWVDQPDSFGAEADLQYGLELLAGAKQGRLGATMRVYRPVPTVAFGQRDAHLPGFTEAARRCRELGFEPLVRKAGGRAAAYHQGCLVLDHVEPHADAVAGAKNRFGRFGGLIASGLRRAGLHAAVGEIPGEYCPGEFSIHGSSPEDPLHRIKLVGTAQRVVAGAWLFSSVVVVENPAPLREVLTASYEALGLDWDPATAGAAEDLLPGLRTESVERALRSVYSGYTDVRDGAFSDLLAQIPAPQPQPVVVDAQPA